MSGLEVAGVLLGGFPLIISGLEHWRDIAKVGGFFWRVRKEYTKCRRDVQFHEILYKRNLKELLLPIVNDADEVTRLMGDPGGKDWSCNALQERLEGRLQESYGLYMEIIREMNETAEEMKKELSLDKAIVQNRLVPPEPKKQRQPSSSQPSKKPSKLASARSEWDYETFRLKFSFNEPVRNGLFDQLKECNARLEKLLRTSDKVSVLLDTAPANTKQTSALETAFKKAWKKSDFLFKALQKAWQCSCQQYHFANLRLEHRTLPDICFEVILTFVSPSSQANVPWSWRELQCGQMIGCSFPYKLTKPGPTPHVLSFTPTSLPTSPRRKRVAFKTLTLSVPSIELDIVDPSVKLCKLLRNEDDVNCMGVICHDDETYHLHPFRKRKRPNDGSPLTLDHVLSNDFGAYLSRRQRYSIALLLASSVAQLHSIAWLGNGLKKEDVFFFPCDDDDCSVPYHEPFIRQGFSPHHLTTSKIEANDCNFNSLGILLLELCFGRRLEDHPLRKRHPTETGETKQAFDLMAALKWSQSVGDEGGDDYASAVGWCFTGANSPTQSWRGDIIKNVVRPLEMCQEHFKTTAVS
ncbi:uncharacterized protein BDZ99DRAFT_389975 [Mytilinidion resinicola]|uniref:DUF7580 domain-containing protein n=1 Tax=Mytilinidion resinicola TaxID=574789 RepID=A0A6A6YM75_9PEZI|nr:uncharacterized protein BDZ99DRAFT_389975 [Mytilinidion resinicola]KAF2808967.1 hypothetical protein BDZ99DRAFT_389975 [Mytilinidion resinicola]